MPQKKLPPKNLSRAAKALFREISRQWGIDDPAGLLLLRSALESWDLVNEARAERDAVGLTVQGTGGTTKANPCIAIEASARASMISAFRALNLDLEPLRDRMGRPTEGEAKLRLVQ